MADALPVAVVTGAASGIGRAIALRLAALGYRLVLIDQSDLGLRQLLSELAPMAPAEHELITADVADADAWRGVYETLEHDGADVALLVQAAGALLAGPLTDCEPPAIARLVEVNLTGALLGAHAIGPLLADSARQPTTASLPRGVLNVASIFATVSPPGFAVYNATKAGVVSLTETLRGEWAPKGLTATAVLPGVTPTGLFDSGAYASEKLRELAVRRVAASKLTPEAVADAAIRAYRRRKLLAPIGGRASRFYRLKRWFPETLLRRAAAEANRELDG